MPANSRWDLIQLLSVKIVKNPGNGRLNNLNDPVLNVSTKIIPIWRVNRTQNTVLYISECHIKLSQKQEYQFLHKIDNSIQSNLYSEN